MKQEVRRTVRAMWRGEFNGTEYCMRGLEHWQSPETFEHRTINKDCAIKAVLDEQKGQKETGCIDPEEIAKAPYLHSKWSKAVALSNAALDAERL